MDKLYDKLDTDKFINDIYSKKCKGYDYTPAILGKKNRIIVFGDIHGDFRLALAMLADSKVIEIKNKKIIWRGGDTYVIQVGDQIDRCRPIDNMICKNKNTTYKDEANDIKILKLFTNLDKQARKVGGAVISLLGNHEIMNSTGYLDYVSYKGLEQFKIIRIQRIQI